MMAHFGDVKTTCICSSKKMLLKTHLCISHRWLIFPNMTDKSISRWLFGWSAESSCQLLRHYSYGPKMEICTCCPMSQLSQLIHYHAMSSSNSTCYSCMTHLADFIPWLVININTFWVLKCRADGQMTSPKSIFSFSKVVFTSPKSGVNSEKEIDNKAIGVLVLHIAEIPRPE